MNETLNLDDISNCPLDTTCRECGSMNDLDVATYSTPLGVFCGTLCAACAVAGHEQQIPGHGAGLHVILMLVMEHCEHLGIGIDQMAAVLEAEQAE